MITALCNAAHKNQQDPFKGTTWAMSLNWPTLII